VKTSGRRRQSSDTGKELRGKIPEVASGQRTVETADDMAGVRNANMIQNGTFIQTRDNAWDRISTAALVDEQEAVLMTPFILQGFLLGRSDPSWNSFSSE
jgi:hypothetical protein